MTGNDLNDSLESVLIVDNQIFKYEEGGQAFQGLPDGVRTVFFVKDEENTPEHAAMLHSIAKACNLQESAYAIISCRFGWKDLRGFENIREVILMGVGERELDVMIDIPLHYVYGFDSRNWIRTVDIATLKQNTEAKSVFWKDVLKPYFLG